MWSGGTSEKVIVQGVEVAVKATVLVGGTGVLLGGMGVLVLLGTGVAVAPPGVWVGSAVFVRVGVMLGGTGVGV